MTLTSLIIYGLATWRLASLLVNESGPWDMFVHLRELCGITHDDLKQKAIIPDGVLAGILSCVWCCSIWVGAFWLLFDWVLPVIALRVGVVFALSAVAILIQGRVGSG
jgi:hypothetical protein